VAEVTKLSLKSLQQTEEKS